MPELVPVRVRDCVHPDLPHPDGDIVYLKPTLSLDGGIRATQDYQAVLSSPMTSEEMAAELTRRWLVTFVRSGAVGANFIDPFDVNVILDDYSIAEPVSEKANDLYSEAVLRPLGLGPAATSPRGQTNGSTSRTRRSTRKQPASS
jgi:hypothetical protein